MSRIERALKRIAWKEGRVAEEWGWKIVYCKYLGSGAFGKGIHHLAFGISYTYYCWQCMGLALRFRNELNLSKHWLKEVMIMCIFN